MDCTSAVFFFLTTFNYGNDMEELAFEVNDKSIGYLEGTVWTHLNYLLCNYSVYLV